MLLHLRPLGPVTANNVIDLGLGSKTDAQDVHEGLENTLAGLMRHRGEPAALAVMVEGFAAFFTERAQASGHAVALRYALEVELSNAFNREASCSLAK